MKTLINPFIVILLFLSCTYSLIAQMPPHPSLLDKISRGEIDIPYTLQNIHKLRAHGIDAAWDSPINKFFEKTRNTRNKNGVTSTNSLLGNYKALVVLVDFSDKPIKTNLTSFDKLLFSNDPKSLVSYLYEITYGTLSLSTENLPSEIKVVRAPQTYEYYTNKKNGQGDYPRNAQKLVEDVLAIIDPNVDFSKYDNNSDGKVDALFIAHSGPGAEYTGKDTDIWSHAWSINEQTRDGVTLSRYSIEPEYWSAPGDMTCGVFAHEMGHAAFGLPDLYDYDTGKKASEGVGNWSLMAGGSWNGNNGNSPSHPDAWCKIKMGIVASINIISDAIGLQVNAIENNPVAYRIWKDGIIGNEYFLFENRQKLGFDASLPGSGILIYHVDDNIKGGRINNNEWYPGRSDSGHYAVALLQADGLFQMEKNINGGDTGDPYPGSSQNRELTGTTLPNNKAYSSDYNNFSLTNIISSAGILSVDVLMNDYFQVPTLNVDYGNVQLSTVIDTTKIYLINSGTEPITINSISNLNSDFIINSSHNFPGNINGNVQAFLNITFIPSSNGPIQDTIIINYTMGKPLVKKIYLSAFGFQMTNVDENILYGAIKKISQGSFISLNMSDGSGVMIGKAGFPDAKSMTISNKTKFLYGLSSSISLSELLKINPKEGDSYSILKIDSVLSAIAFDVNDVLYGISGSGVLYKINLLNGQCESIGNTGLKITGLAFNPITNELFGSIGLGPDNKDGIFKINTVNGTPTLVGNTGFNNYTSCIAFDRKGNLYGIRNTLVNNNDLLKIDPNTGTGSLVGSTNFKGVKGIAIYNSNTTEVERNVISNLPDTYNLEQNFPNPFNPTTTIKYQIPENTFVTLKVFDVLGKEIATLVDKELTPGEYNYQFTIFNSQLPSGIYIYQLRTGNFSEVKKMLLLK